MAVVQKHGNRLTEAGSHHDQIDSMVAVDIAGQKLQASDWSYQPNRLAAHRGQLKLNRVNALGRVAASNFDSGQVWIQITIEISDGKRLARRNSGDRRVLNLCA